MSYQNFTTKRKHIIFVYVILVLHEVVKKIVIVLMKLIIDTIHWKTQLMIENRYITL